MSKANPNPPAFPPNLKGGMAPLAATREQSIADSVANSAEFQHAFPDIDWKARVIEPTVNMAFDLKVPITGPPLPVSFTLLPALPANRTTPMEGETPAPHPR